MTNSGNDAQTEPLTEVRTSVFAVGRASFLRHILGRSIRIVVICCLLPALIACVGAIWDLRFLILALMILMILLPMALAFVYFDKALSPFAALNVVDHYIIFGREGISVTTRIPQFTDYDNEYPRDTDSAPDPEIRDKVTEIPGRQITSWIGDSFGLTLNLNTDKNTFLLIPYSAFSGTEALRNTIALLNSYKS